MIPTIDDYDYPPTMTCPYCNAVALDFDGCCPYCGADLLEEEL